MTMIDRFGDMWLPVSAPFTPYVIKRLIHYNLTFPDGISSDYAFQSVTADTGTILGQAEIQATVDALQNTFSCQSIDMSLDTEDFDKLLPASKDFKGAPNRDTIGLVFQTLACQGIQTMRLYRPQWTGDHFKAMTPGDSCTVTFSRINSMSCGGQVMVAIFGNLRYIYPPEPKEQPYLVELTNSTQIICTAATYIGKVDITYYNSTDTNPTSITPSSSSRFRLGVEDTRQILASSFESHFQRKGRSDLASIDISGITVDTDSIMTNALKIHINLTPNISAETMFKPMSLETAFTRYIKLCNAVVAKQYMMVKEQASISGIITANDSPILVQQPATRLIAGLEATCALLTAAAMFFVPSSSIVPCSSTGPLRISSFILHSHKLLAVLRHSAHTSSVSLNHLQGLQGGKQTSLRDLAPLRLIFLFRIVATPTHERRRRSTALEVHVPNPNPSAHYFFVLLLR